MAEKVNIIQTSFAAGEVSPALYGRVDLAKYRAGARVMRNFFTLVTGGAAMRPGTQFVGRAKNTNLAAPPRLIPFAYNTLQTYALEFGELYMRVIMNGGYVLEPALVIAGITQANPGVFNVNNHGFAVGDQLFAAGITGMTALNSTAGFQLKVASVPDANHFTCTDLDGNVINTSAMPAYTGGGMVARVYTLATPWHAADLPLLKFTQSADVMTLCHPNYPPYDLTRSQHWAWTLTQITFASPIAAPTGQAAAPVNNPGGTSTQFGYAYVITAVVDDPAGESVPSAYATCTNALLNQNTGVVNNISWNPVAGANRYRIYATQPSAPGANLGTTFGYIGQSDTTSFTDANIAPDYSNGPPSHLNPFAGGNNPGCVSYYEGRRIFGGSTSQPDTFWASQTDNFACMDASSPTKDTDAITATLATQQVNAIKHLISIAGSLLALTSSGAWQISPGSQSDSLTPTSTVAKAQAYIGCSDVPPIAINYDVLYVEGKQARVRDLAYNYFVNLFTGDDKSVLSDHLFNGRQIEQWAYAAEPFKIIWVVRDDGVALAFTFLKEQDVYAWSRHDTYGLFESVCSISEGNEDAVYFVVTRIIPGVNGGNPVQYIERLHSRDMGGNPGLGIPTDVSLGWFVDCGLAYGPTMMTGANLYPGLGACNGGAQGVPFTADANIFTAGMVGDVIRANGGIGTIASYVSPTEVTVNVWPWAPFAPIPNDPNITATPPAPAKAVPLPASSGNWSCTTPVSSVSGLDHLNGMTVSILADGNVQPQQVVQNGTVTVQQPASIIIVGLPYTGQLMTLPLDLGEPTIAGKRKRVGALNLILQDTRGLKVGPVKLNGDTANLPALVEIKERTSQNYGQPIPLTTGYERVIPMPLWQKEGVILLQQDNPLPATVLAVVPELVVGDDQG